MRMAFPVVPGAVLILSVLLILRYAMVLAVFDSVVKFTNGHIVAVLYGNAVIILQ